MAQKPDGGYDTIPWEYVSLLLKACQRAEVVSIQTTSGHLQLHSAFSGVVLQWRADPKQQFPLKLPDQF